MIVHDRGTADRGSTPWNARGAPRGSSSRSCGGPAGARSPGSRARARSPARAPPRLGRSPRPAGSRRARTAGRRDSGLRSCAMRGDRDGLLVAALIGRAQRRSPAVHGAHGLQRPGRDQRRHDRERERRPDARRRRQPGAGHPLGRSGGAASASGAARARAAATQPHEQRRQRVAGHEPGPVDRRVHAEHHDAAAIVHSPTRSASNGRPRSRRRIPSARSAASSHASRQQRQPEADPAEVGERLHDVAVRVADDQRRRCAVARAHVA